MERMRLFSKGMKTNFIRTIWKLTLAILVAAILSTALAAQTSVYQYAVSVGDRTAYLWVPPACPAVRGVLMSLANLTERRWLEDATIRTVASQECLGTIWIGPGSDTFVNADMQFGSGEALLQMLRDFAQISGFPEVAFAPVIPMGHSAHGQFAWKFAKWAPDRTIAAIPIKTVPLPPDLHLSGVPLLYIVGETTEWPQYRDGRPGDRDFFWPVVQESAVQLRQSDPDSLIAVATEPGGGHFDWSAAQAKLIALYIQKACQFRLPPHPSQSGIAKLRPLRVTDGWLTDARGMAPDRRPPAAFGKYKGDKSQAYWFFDRETALAASAFNGDRKHRQKQMLTFLQDGQLLPVAKRGFASLKFEPEADGVTFKLTPAFLSRVPDEFVDAGAPLGHAAGPIQLSIITGPAEQISATEFRLSMERGGIGGDIWIEAEQDGDSKFRKAVQPGMLHLPARFAEGAPQSISFDPIPDQPSTASPIGLHAVSTSGLPVRFFVEYGPAKIDGDHLVITEVPEFGNKSIEVKVIAYQWGRMAGSSGESAIQSAAPVAHTFHLIRETGPGSQSK